MPSVPYTIGYYNWKQRCMHCVMFNVYCKVVILLSISTLSVTFTTIFLSFLIQCKLAMSTSRCVYALWYNLKQYLGITLSQYLVLPFAIFYNPHEAGAHTKSILIREKTSGLDKWETYLPARQFSPREEPHVRHNFGVGRWRTEIRLVSFFSVGICH